jgi:hypothetical protein
MHNITALSAQDAMVMVLTGDRKATVSSFSETLEFPPVVPAARFLAKITPKCSLVAKLRTRGRGCALGKRGISLIDGRAFGDLGQGCESTYTQTFIGFLYAFQVLQCADADNAFQTKNVIANASQKICPS